VYKVIQPNSWDDMRHLILQMTGQWAFRGQTKESWGLSTTLERAMFTGEHSEKKDLNGEKEKIILWEFKRRAHHYLPSVPSDTQHLEWLALLQHYGGVTRLLDYSYSFYVAAFFAVEKLDPNEDAAIWAINLKIVNRVFKEKMKFSNEYLTKEDINHKYNNELNRLIWKNDNESLVFPVEPDRMNERLAIQQGLFLFPLNPKVGFEANLAAVFNEDKEVFKKKASANYNPEVHTTSELEKAVVVKIIVQDYLREQILNDLWKMNVSSATLFPGIDGFARSLRYHLL